MLPVALKTGTLVVATGVVAKPELNGRCGAVVARQGADRFVVDFGGGQQTALRAEKLCADATFAHAVFWTNFLAVGLSLLYIVSSVFAAKVAVLAFRAALVLYGAHHAYLVRNTGVFAFSLDGVQAVARTPSGQLLLWIVAFLSLGEPCYSPLAALACYAMLNMALVADRALLPIRRVPLLSTFAFRFERLQQDLQRVADSMAVYDQKDWSSEPVKRYPPAHVLEIAGVCFELFTALQQLLTVMLSATTSLVMFVVCWRFLAYRYAQPENRTVRTVLNKAREQLTGYFEMRFVPSAVRQGYLWAADRVWGDPVPP